MTTLATRIRKLSDLEGFDVIVLDSSGDPVDPRVNGFRDYAFDRKSNSSMTVSAWIELRFNKIYPGYSCSVLNGDGTIAHGNTKLESVRETYEDDQCLQG